jgi:hypothetical protein
MSAKDFLQSWQARHGPAAPRRIEQCRGANGALPNERAGPQRPV